MIKKHTFDSQRDSEKLAMEIVEFLRKWGLWKDVQIITGKKCYSDKNGDLQVRSEMNPERLLDMTFEGPLCTLLRHHEYEVRIQDVSEEIRPLILPEPRVCTEDVEIRELMEDYLRGDYSWDPAEFDSYEDWLEASRYQDMDLFATHECSQDIGEFEFSTREEYEDFIIRAAAEREAMIEEYFSDELYEETYEEAEMFYDDGKIAQAVIEEFNSLLEKYGLWYELGYSWSLTTYRC